MYLPNNTHLIKVTEQGPCEMEKPGQSHLFPLLFLALLLCITKQGSCERVGVEWLDFGANALLLVFLLPCSLFALSSPDNTLWVNTLGNVLHILQSTFHLAQSMWYSRSLFGLLSYMRKKETHTGTGERNEKGMWWSLKCLPGDLKVDRPLWLLLSFLLL